MNGTKFGRDALVRQFATDGLDIIFGNPGSTESGLLDALTEFSRAEQKKGRNGIRYILGLHETAVLGMADAYARATRRPTLVQVHAPAGLGNSIGMIYQAYQGFSPLVILAGSSGMRYDTMKGLLSGDQVRIVEPVTKWAGRASTASSLLRLARHAVKTAATLPQKPVFLELPMDVLDEPTEGEVIPTPVVQAASHPPIAIMNDIVKVLLKADRPYFIIGDGISISGAQHELAQVAELVGARVFGAFNHEVNMSHKNLLYQGVLGWNDGNDARKKIMDADVVLICGTTVTTQLFPFTGNLFPENATIVHIDAVADEIAFNYPIDIGVVCDPKSALGLISEQIKECASSEHKDGAKKRAEAIKRETRIQRQEEIKKDEEEAERSFHVSIFMKEFSAKMPDNTVVFDEAITNSASLTRYLQPDRPSSYYLLRGGVLGAGVSGAVGLKLAKPNQTVVGFIGDGASMFSIHALWTAARYDLDVKLIICNNKSYRILKINMQKYWNTSGQKVLNKFPAEFDLELPDPCAGDRQEKQRDQPIDFVSLAKAFGVPGMKVDSSPDVKIAVEKLFSVKGPYLIDLVLDQKVNIENQHEESHCSQ